MRRTLYASVLLAYFACDGTVEASPRKSSLIDSKHNPYSMHDDPGVEIPKRQRAPWLSLPFVIKGNGKGIGRKAWRIPSFEIVNDERQWMHCYSCVLTIVIQCTPSTKCGLEKNKTSQNC